MKNLDIAIQAEGGISKLARKLGEEPNVLSNWMKRGTPKGWDKYLGLLYKKQAKAAKADESVSV